jgi:hypothetical protein
MFTSCKQEKTLSEKEKSEMVQSIRETLGNYYKDVRERGLRAEFAYLDSSTEFYWVPPGFSHPLSYDRVVAIVEQNAKLYIHIDNRIDTLRVLPLSSTLASYSARLRSTMTDTGNRTTNFTLVETGLFIKRPDGWKLLNGQTAILDHAPPK